MGAVFIYEHALIIGGIPVLFDHVLERVGDKAHIVHGEGLWRFSGIHKLQFLAFDESVSTAKI